MTQSLSFEPSIGFATPRQDPPAQERAEQPSLLALARRGYSQADLQKISSGNMLRVMRASDAYAAAHRTDPPIENPTTF